MEFINGNKFADLADRKRIYYMKIDEVGLLNRPQHPYILITHNGDLPVHGEGMQRLILNDPNLIKWYGQNITIEHPKLQSIPIGLDRSMSEHIYTNADLDLYEKKNLMYVRYWGDSMVKQYRDSVRDALKRQGYTQETKVGITEYLINLKKAMFCPCPNGNGVDTHSIWECIYMGCVPIVEKSINTMYYTDLPVLIIDDWNKLPLLSEHLYKEIRHKSLEKSDFNYWKQLITQTK